MQTPGPNQEQEAFWDAQAGPVWVRNAAAMDACLAPVLDLVLDAANIGPGQDVLDIGCGAGISTFAVATKVGPTGSALGVDISKTLLAHATAQESDARFLYADAEIYPFAPSSVDVIVSRFGVMFFDNPVAALRNMARALRPGGRMVFAAWGAIPNNPFFILPAAVSKVYLGQTPKTDPDGPGPFAFRDGAKITAMMRDAGLEDVAVDVRDIMLTPSGGVQGFAELALQIGPAESAVRYFGATQDQIDTLKSRIVKAAKTHLRDGVLLLPAEINLFAATRAFE